MVETPQQPFERRGRSHVVGAGKAEQQEETRGIDGDGQSIAGVAGFCDLHEEDCEGDHSGDKGRRVNKSVGDQFADAIGPFVMTGCSGASDIT